MSYVRSRPFRLCVRKHKTPEPNDCRGPFTGLPLSLLFDPSSQRLPVSRVSRVAGPEVCRGNGELGQFGGTEEDVGGVKGWGRRQGTSGEEGSPEKTPSSPNGSGPGVSTRPVDEHREY